MPTTTLRAHSPLALALTVLFLLGVLPAAQAGEFRSDNPLNQPGKIYWCPNRTADKRITATPDAGCTALYDAERDEKKPASLNPDERNDAAAKEPLKILDIQNEASKFTRDYRVFLDCCASEWDSLDRIDELLEQSNHILMSVQQKGIYNSAGFGVGSGAAGLGGGPGQSPKLGTFARQWTLSEIVGTVAIARDDLKKIRTRMKGLITRYEKLDSLDYEQRGREERRIEDERETIAQDLRPKRPAASAPTGMDIQDTTIPTRIGGDIENTHLNRSLNPSFGADIGTTVSPYSNVNESLRPRRGEDLRDSVLTDRVGAQTQDTTLPNASGFEINAAENAEHSSSAQIRGVGPSIGDSSLNSQSRR
ncbi:MAG: conserved exported protein of unknown function [Nitrospira sp.]|nr:MAG: conserved exported protein of unknown function [Nitrospira sp.]